MVVQHLSVIVKVLRLMWSVMCFIFLHAVFVLVCFPSVQTGRAEWCPEISIPAARAKGCSQQIDSDGSHSLEEGRHISPPEAVATLTDRPGPPATHRVRIIDGLCLQTQTNRAGGLNINSRHIS